MKNAVLMLLLAPSAFAGTVARFSATPASVVAPIQLMAPNAPGLMASSFADPALGLAPMVAAQSIVALSLTATPIAAQAVAAALVPAAPRVQSAQALSATPPLSAAASDGTDGPARFDGAANRETGAQLVDPRFGSYRRLDYSEQGKVDATERYARASATFGALKDEFGRQGGYYLLDSNPNAKYMAAAAVDQNRRPVIILTYDLLNRYNGRSEDIYRGAPWEFIASVIAREQVFFNGWYGVIPASAEKLALSYMNMTRVFVELTNGTSRSWATDKDYQATQGDNSTNVNWNWFEQLVIAARAAINGAGTDSGHLNDSTLFSWARDWTSVQDKAAIPAFQYSLWEQYDGRYYRPGDSKNGQPLPPGAPRIDKATYDQAAGTAYGVDGKGRAQNGQLDQQSAYGWIIQWLKDRFEI
jgi:hypothetical protein